MVLQTNDQIQIEIMEESPETQGQLVSSHGMLAILEVLEARKHKDVTMKLLQIVNLVGDDGLKRVVLTAMVNQIKN